MEIASERSRSLPPPEAWKRPDRWIDVRTGLAKRGVSQLVFKPDDRGLINPHAAVSEAVDTFFWSDYDWPYDPSDVQTRPDDHHFYYDRAFYLPEAHDGNEIPQRFRELATNIGRMPRQLHNTLHLFTAAPEMPEMDAMEAYVNSYDLAHAAFMRLDRLARRQVRKLTPLNEGEVPPRMTELEEQFIMSFFNEHFKDYSIAVELFRIAEQNELLDLELRDLRNERAKEVLRGIGALPTRQYLNFTPLLQAA